MIKYPLKSAIAILITILLINSKASAQNNFKNPVNNTDSIFSVIDKLPDSLKIDTLKKTVNNYAKSGNYAYSIIILREMLKLQSICKDSTKKIDLRIYINSKIGRSFNSMGLFSKAMKHSFKALHDAKRTKDTIHIIENLIDISYQYDQLLLPKLSKKNILEALKYAERFNDKETISHVLNCVGNVYSSSNNNDSAIHYYKMSNKYMKEIHKTPYFITYMNIGEIFKSKKIQDSALIYFDMAKKGIASMSLPLTKTNLHLQYASVFYEQNKLDLAEQNVKNSLKISVKSHFNKEIIYSYNLLGLIYAKKRDYKQSIIYQNKYTELKDSVMAVNQQTAVSRIELIYDAENKKLRINKLEAENLLKSGRLIMLIISLILMIIVSTIIYYQKTKIKKAYNLIVKDSIKSKDLHEEITLLRIELNNVKKTKYDFAEEKKTLSENKNTILTEKQADFIEFEIRKAFDEDKIYLDKNLSLKTLSDSIGSNRYYISQVLNNKIKINFSDMLNTYRVNKTKKILLEENSSKYTFEAIAEKSGFNSKATFNRSFKKITGITPSFFLKNAKNNIS